MKILGENLTNIFQKMKHLKHLDISKEKLLKHPKNIFMKKIPFEGQPHTSKHNVRVELKT